MARIITSLRLTVSDNPGFQDVFPVVNRLMTKKNDDLMFVSAFGGVLNVRTGLFRYYNGGHNPPFVALKGSSFDQMELPMGTLLGVLEDCEYELAELQLEAGDALVLYTDGVSEATRTDKEMFGEDRAQAFLNKSEFTNMEDLVFGFEQHINLFVDGAPQFDDLTILAIRYLG